MTPPSIYTALNDARKKLGDSVDLAQMEGEILLAHILGCNRTYLRTWPEQALDSTQQKDFQNLLERRIKGEPIAYLTGKRDFWDMTLLVTADTLIPRPETEQLVELALEKIPEDANWKIADLGTGSGAIALAIARERSDCQITATDTSNQALAVAGKNANRLNLTNITIQHGSWCEPLGDLRYEMIISNPPYVHPEDPHLGQGDLRFEPTLALKSEPDGLMDIREIARTARDHLTEPGWLFLEHGFDQGPAVTKILEDLGYNEVNTFNDLNQNDRICRGKWG